MALFRQFLTDSGRCHDENAQITAAALSRGSASERGKDGHSGRACEREAEGRLISLMRLLLPLVVGAAAMAVARDDSARSALRRGVKGTSQLCRAVQRRSHGVCKSLRAFILHLGARRGNCGSELQGRRTAPASSLVVSSSGRGDEVPSNAATNELGRIVSRLEELAGKVELEMAALACATETQATGNWGPGRLGGDASVRLAIVSERLGSATRRTELLTRQLQNSSSGITVELPPDVGYLMAILQQRAYSTGRAISSNWLGATTPSRNNSPSMRYASSPTSTPTGPTCVVQTVGPRDEGDDHDAAQPVTARQTADTIMQSCIEWDLFNDMSCEGLKLLAASLSSEMSRDTQDVNVQSFWLAVIANLLCMVHEATPSVSRTGEPGRGGAEGGTQAEDALSEDGVPKDWFEQFLVNSMTSKFLSIRQGALDRLTTAIDAYTSQKAASASPRPSAQWVHVVRLLDVLAAALCQAQVPTYLTQQLFSHLFNLLDEHLFNAVLLHNQLCSFETVEQFLVGTKMLRQWISGTNARLTGLRHCVLMSYSQQALEFLQALSEKSSGSTLKATDLVASICPRLSSYHCYLLYCGAVKANARQSGFFSQNDLTLLRRSVDASEGESEGLFIVHKTREFKHDIAALCASVRASL